MKTLIMKLLGLDVLMEATVLLTQKVDELEAKNKELTETLTSLDEKVDEIDIPDMDDYVSESDINDRIESYMNDNDYVMASYVDDEIESKVEEKVGEALEELDLTEKVKEVVDDMDKASFGDYEELETIIKKEVKRFVLNSVEVRMEVK